MKKFLDQNINKKSFVIFFIDNKIFNFKNNKIKLKNFFRGLIYYVFNLQDENDKKYFWYLLNNDIT